MTTQHMRSRLVIGGRAGRIIFNWRDLAILVGACVLGPAVLTLSVIDRHERFSPIDEVAHADYVWTLPEAGIPRMGDPISQTGLRESVCRGVALEGLGLPTCSERYYAPAEFGGGGLQHEAQQPPLYYASAVPIAWAGQHVLSLSRLAATRLASVAWLCAGLAVLFVLGRSFGLDRWLLGSLVVLVATSPVVVYHSSTVNNDAPALFFGGALCAVAVAVHRRGVGMPVMASAIGVLAGLTKTTMVGAALAVGTFLLLLWFDGRRNAVDVNDRRRAWDVYGRTGLGMAVGAVGAAACWNLAVRWRALVPGRTFPTFDVLRVGEPSLWRALRRATVALNPLTDSYTPFTASPDLTQLAAFGLRGVFVGIGLLLLVGASRQWWSLAGTLVVVWQYLGAVAISLGMWSTFGFVITEARFGLALVPASVIVLSAAVQRRVPRRVVTVLALGCSLLFVSIVMRSPLA